MKDKEARREYWKENFKLMRGWSPACPFEVIPNYQVYFLNKDVLEVGPGDGRQFKELCSITKSHSVADIVPEILEQTIFNNTKKFLIETFLGYLQEKFDTICFWYVLHHIRRDEGKNFFKFLEKHLREDGYIVFNAPLFSPSHILLNRRPGDGILMSPWTITEIRDILSSLSLNILHEYNTPSVYNYLFVVQKTT